MCDIAHYCVVLDNNDTLHCIELASPLHHLIWSHSQELVFKPFGFEHILKLGLYTVTLV